MPKFCLDFFAASTTPPSCKIVLRWSFYGMYLTLTALHITPKLFILKFVSRNIEVDNTEKKIILKQKLLKSKIPLLTNKRPLHIL